MTEFPETQSQLLALLGTHQDREAWDLFVSLYRPLIYRLARKHGFQEADAQDVTQRVLVSVADSIGRWQQANDSTRFRHWLRRVAKNAIINFVTRRPQDVGRGGSSIQRALLSHDDQIAENEIELEYKRELYHVAAARVRESVDEDTWRAFHMTVVDQLDIQQVADDLNKSIGNVYAARSRVMRRLKNAIQDLEQEE